MQKKFKRLDNFFFEKGQNPSFLYTPYVVVTEEGTCLFVEKVVPENTGHPMQQKVSCS